MVTNQLSAEALHDLANLRKLSDKVVERLRDLRLSDEDLVDVVVGLIDHVEDTVLPDVRALRNRAVVDVVKKLGRAEAIRQLPLSPALVGNILAIHKAAQR